MQLSVAPSPLLFSGMRRRDTEQCSLDSATRGDQTLSGGDRMDRNDGDRSRSTGREEEKKEKQHRERKKCEREVRSGSAPMLML